jgi:hypothetical protein
LLSVLCELLQQFLSSLTKSQTDIGWQKFPFNLPRRLWDT